VTDAAALYASVALAVVFVSAVSAPTSASSSAVPALSPRPNRWTALVHLRCAGETLAERLEPLDSGQRRQRSLCPERPASLTQVQDNLER
jgi:hypothetical protein